MKRSKKIIFFIIKIIAFLLFSFYYFNKKIIIPFIRLIQSELLILYLKLYGAKIGTNLRIGKNPTIRISKNSKITIGNNVVIGKDVYINVKKNSELFIGDNVHINKGVRISSFKFISIGSNVLIASYCNILDHNHKYDLQSPASTVYYDSAPIIIKEGAWLGTKVQVNKGVSIGKYTVVASNAVVTKNLEKSCVYGGIPAKKIKCLKK